MTPGLFDAKANTANSAVITYSWNKLVWNTALLAMTGTASTSLLQKRPLSLSPNPSVDSLLCPNSTGGSGGHQNGWLQKRMDTFMEERAICGY